MKVKVSREVSSLKGKRKEIWSISVGGNWQITFKFENGNVLTINYEDYH